MLAGHSTVSGCRRPVNAAVTIVIPTYRRPEFLREALCSIADTRLHRECGEIIVVDDGHDEDVKRVCDATRVGHRLRYMRSDKGPRAGPATCRNQGIRAGRGDLVYLLDDDDTFLPNRFDNSLGLLADRAFNVVLEPSLRVYLDASSHSPFITGPYGEPSNAFRFLLTGGPRSHITPGATAFRREIFEKVGGYDEGLRFGEDGEFLLRLCLHGRVALLEGPPVVRIAIHDSNTSTSAGPQYWVPILFLSRLYGKTSKSLFPEEMRLLANILSDKLDYALTRSWQTAPSYAERLRQGLRILRCFNWRCATAGNLKSVGVWLTKRAGGRNRGPKEAC